MTRPLLLALVLLVPGLSRAEEAFSGAYDRIQNSSVNVLRRRKLNVVNGGCVDNPVTHATDCTFSAGGGTTSSTTTSTSTSSTTSTSLPHALLGPRHSDTTTQSPTRGSLIVANSTPAWDELTLGTNHQYVRVVTGDPTWSTLFLEDALNEGTTVTVLHGNAAGHPFFDPINLATDVNGVLQTGKGGTGLTGVGSLHQVLMVDGAATGLEYRDLQSSEVAGLSEAIDDRAAALIQNGIGLTWTYDDALNTLTGNVIFPTTTSSSTSTSTSSTTTTSTSSSTSSTSTSTSSTTTTSTSLTSTSTLLDCASAPPFFCLAGRTGATNNPTISTDDDGVLYGSATPGKVLYLAPDSTITPSPALGKSVVVGQTATGQGSIAIGSGLAAGFLPFSAAGDSDLGQTATLGFFLLNGGLAASPTIFGVAGHGSDLAAATQSGDYDNLINIRGVATDPDGNFTFGAAPVTLVFAGDGPPGSGFAPGQAVFVMTDRTGRVINYFWIRHDGRIGIGNDNGYPEGRLHVQNVGADVVATVFQGEVGQTANLTNWDGRIEGALIDFPLPIAGGTVLTFVDSSMFAPSGTIWLRRNDALIGSDLEVAYSSNNTGTNEITLVAPLPYDVHDVRVFQTTIKSTVAADGRMSKYRSVPTAGFGLGAIVAADRATAQTAANTSVATFTPADDGTFLVSANVLVTTATTHSFTVTCAYTDEGNTARTLTLTFSSLAGVLATPIVNTGGAVPYAGIPAHIRAKGGTAITVKTTGVFTSVTYNVDAQIMQIS